MNPKRFLAILFTFSLAVTVAVRAQENAKPKVDPPEPRAKDGKKLLTALDLLKINGVSNPRISPDGSRVAYTVSEVKMEKDKEWKSVTQVWVVPTNGGTARQYTRGDKSATAPEWSPDGTMLAFLTDREKEAERQVWMMMADGGEAWAVTSHKGGVSGFHFSPDGKHLILIAVDQPGKDEEDRKKVKDDTIVIDQDIKMTHLWLFDLGRKEEKRLTEGNYTVSDPQWSPDGTRISYVTRPTPKADDGDLDNIWVLNVASGDKKQMTSDEASSQSARWSPDGKWIAYNGSERGAVSTDFLQLIPAEGGTSKRLTAQFELPAGTPVWSPDGRTIYFTTNTLEAIEVYSANVSTGTVKQLSRSGGFTGVVEISRDGKTIVGTTASATRPGEIYVAGGDLRAMKPLTDHNAWLNDYSLANSEVVKWKSQDGTEIEGVLTKPVGYSSGKIGR